MKDDNSTIIERMISVDNFLFSAFVNSMDLRKSILALTHEEVTSSVSSISKIVKDYSKIVIEYFQTEISAIKKATITMDEWSSRSRRFLNVNLHSIDKRDP